MSDSLTISGLGTLSGETVSAVIAGLDCGDYIVDVNGTITVPFGSDPDGLFQPAYLAQISNPGAYGDTEASFVITNGSGDAITVNVPVVVGYAYASQGQTLRPATAEQGRSPQGPLLGKTRRNHRFAALLQNTQGVNFGSVLTDTLPADFRDSGGTVLTKDQLFSGVHRSEVLDDYSMDGTICWTVSRPYPCTVCSIGGFMEVEEL